jgi:mannosyl-3-phosphoglycerate phosphatase
MKIVFSDLDGTLLHLQTYSSEAAQPALDGLKSCGIPLVFCTSKTRAEVEFWRERLGNSHPFIVENGGAIYVPKGYFGKAIRGAARREQYEVIELGAPYAELVEDLRAASVESGCQALGFNDMTVADISIRTLLPVHQAELAKQREYDEPFVILGQATHSLLLAIEKRGRRWTRGDRFYHIMGSNDKAEAVRKLAKVYSRVYGAVETVGLGDGHNDTAFLSAVDTPIIIRSPFATVLKKAVPRSRVTQAPGPHGWNEAILEVLQRPAAMAV